MICFKFITTSSCKRRKSVIVFLLLPVVDTSAFHQLKSFRHFRHKPRQLIVEYYLHWTPRLRYFSGSSDTNHDSLLYRILYLQTVSDTYLRTVLLITISGLPDVHCIGFLIKFFHIKLLLAVYHWRLRTFLKIEHAQKTVNIVFVINSVAKQRVKVLLPRG